MIRESDGRILVEGPITMETAAGLLEAGRGLCRQSDFSAHVIDLGGVAGVDSAALAVVLAWMRAAREAGHVLTLENVPAQLHSLASLYDLSEVMPLSGTPAAGSNA
ncbi:STAS domain-containing protein [Niveibacterium sp. SC-1]|uniref:STAS domain-containing protein n=1 Tax=Niveibacterium sp. SC-1 TaxID=3135646 RepID=UPI003120261C